MDYKEKLDILLRENNYFSLATIDGEGNPWISSLTYVYGEDYSLYFISNKEATHVKNFMNSKYVAINIFDSTQGLEKVFGAQGFGSVKKINASDVPDIIRGDLLSKVSMIILNRPYAFFCIQLKEMYLPNMERWKDDTPLRVCVFRRK